MPLALVIANHVLQFFLLPWALALLFCSATQLIFRARARRSRPFAARLLRTGLGSAARNPFFKSSVMIPLGTISVLEAARMIREARMEEVVAEVKLATVWARLGRAVGVAKVGVP